MEIAQKKKYQISIIAFLVVLSYLLAYYFQNILKTSQIYTHFFYIPIILSCIWWRRKGLYVTGVLLAMLLLGQLTYFHNAIRVDDWVRALMLTIVSLLAVGLSEALAGAKKQLADSEIRYRKIFETTGTAMAIIEEDTIISLVNSEYVSLSGYSKEELENKKSFLDFVLKEDLEKISAYHYTRRIAPDRVPIRYEFKFVTRNNDQRDILAAVDMVPGTRQSVVSFSDITEMKQTLKRQKELQVQLSIALAKVLSGFIPICANCKSIRNEENHWIQIESFLHEKTEADFSHGICPDCAKKLYPEFYSDEHEQAQSG
ncbi:MAG: PAS domain S-box protein [Proteobacteria bacterium]|nr:PAS domain S-box protein [Pseudomonadota bacterium]MBU4469197.1 PAS domain S-box protein [Pseudomonadota bacterium]MCG2752228.1 PAS domain S-box protein [Desulfobacteraceae bacterium]